MAKQNRESMPDLNGRPTGLPNGELLKFETETETEDGKKISTHTAKIWTHLPVGILTPTEKSAFRDEVDKMLITFKEKHQGQMDNAVGNGASRGDTYSIARVLEYPSDYNGPATGFTGKPFAFVQLHTKFDPHKTGLTPEEQKTIKELLRQQHAAVIEQTKKVIAAFKSKHKR